MSESNKSAYVSSVIAALAWPDHPPAIGAAHQLADRGHESIAQIAKSEAATAVRFALGVGGCFGHHIGGGGLMIRGLFVAAAVAAAAICAASTVESVGSATSPVIFTASCPPGEYWNVDVHCPGPTPTPSPGDTYQCKDGCYSDSPNPQRACSRYGGIDHSL
jgi:hypothetical protein